MLMAPASLRLLHQNVDAKHTVMHACFCVCLRRGHLVCTHRSVVEHSMHRCVLFVYVPVCSWGSLCHYTADFQPGIHITAFSAVCVNARMQNLFGF